MERLTDHENEHYNQPGCNSCSDYRWRSCKESGEIDDCIQRLTWLRLLDIEDILGDDYDLDRLREIVQKNIKYEQTGLEPEEIEQLKGEVFGLKVDKQELEQYRAIGPIDRLRKLVEADRDGRCVALLSNDDVYTIRGDILNGIIKANCRDACKPPESALKREQNGKA